jgi:hypothetical protein
LTTFPQGDLRGEKTSIQQFRIVSDNLENREQEHNPLIVGRPDQTRPNQKRKSTLEKTVRSSAPLAGKRHIRRNREKAAANSTGGE